MGNYFEKALMTANKVANEVGAKKIESEHLFCGVLFEENAKISKFLLNFGINYAIFVKILNSVSKNDQKFSTTKLPISSNLVKLLKDINENENVFDLNSAYELFVRNILSNEISRPSIIIKKVLKVDLNLLLTKLNETFSFTSEKMEKNILSSKSLLPTELQSIGVDLTQKIKNNLSFNVVGRDDETERIIEILCRKTKNNPVLIGEPGVGKTAVVEGLAKRIIEGDVPSFLVGKIVFSLDLASLMSGTKFRGTMEEKLKNAIAAIMENGNIILYIDEIHMLGEAGKDGEMSPADILKPFLARGELHCVGSTTPIEYKKYIEADSALERRFQPVTVDEPTRDDTILILKGIRPSFENFHNVKITNEAIEAAVDLSIRYITNRNLPDKAIDLIDEACSKIKVSSSELPNEVKSLNLEILSLTDEKKSCLLIENYSKANEINNKIKELESKIDEFRFQKYGASQGLGEISAESIKEVVSKWTNIPINKLTSTEKEKLLNLENYLSSRVIGQDEAVKVVSQAIRRAKADIGDPNRPIGSFLFLGPTGVGKTELTKALADVMFESDDNIIRFDMSEFMESHSISRLIGAPPGYVGFDKGGELTEAVKNKPYSIVLFDEIEKAHPDIFNILLQIFDEGKLTDSNGKHINFRNTIIILTSNNGVQELLNYRKEEMKFDTQKTISTEEFLINKLRDKFKPELLNRIDSIVIFDNLSKQSVLKIADIMIDSLVKRFEKKNITLKVSQSARMLVCEKGYDEEYGARPLRRVIDKEIKDPLAEMIISGKLDNCSVISVDTKDSCFTFNILC